MKKRQKRNSVFWVTLTACGVLLAAPLIEAATRNISFVHAKRLFSAAADSDSTVKLPFPFQDRETDKYSSSYDHSKIYLQDPSNIESTVEYDPETGQYNISENMGKLFYRNPGYLTFDEFVEKEYRSAKRKYWLQRANEEEVLQRKALIPKIHVGGEGFDRIFGGNTVDIRLQGSAELIFGVKRSTNQNPSLPENLRKPPAQFDFNQKIQMNVVGNIGDKMKITTNYNTEATFDFENQMKLEYTGYEDEIIKKIEAGNVNLPLSGSLITGSQSLFGIKTALQFGRLTVTSVYSQQKGKSSTIEVKGGAQTSFFDIKADQYEANRHFFLSQYFKDHYDEALKHLPIITSSINITKVEVWITNKTGIVDNTRNIVAFTDLGEANPYDAYWVPNPAASYPDNTSNSLYGSLTGAFSAVRDIKNDLKAAFSSTSMEEAKDYEKLVNARKLAATDFTFNARLGYISLNQSLNADEVLAVAYEYTVGGNIYRVGELTTGGINAPEALFVKLLKNANLNTHLPTWDLMMKNIYSIGTFNVSNKDFKLDVMYDNAATGLPVNYLPATAEPNVNGIPLIRVLSLDRLNGQNDPQPDGVFDFVDGVTINADKGRIIFPVREPFGSYLRSKFGAGNQLLANSYVFDFLYDSTKTRAQQDLEHNKFSIRGSFQSSSSSEISLNAFNIPQGAVTVTAGAVKLVENTDYTVDYTSGKVKIINEGILNSGTPIKVNVESNALFNLQTKTLMGSRFDYVVNKDFLLGGTILHLRERPLTAKVSIGDEPISNTIWGLDGTYRTESRFLTRMVDRLPFIDTKETSTVTVSGEFAQLVPGHSKAIGKEGTSYIDDFEGSKTPMDIKSVSSWVLASTPQGQPNLFPEASLSNNLNYGKNRGRLAWYIIDQTFYDENKAPDYITADKDQISNHYVRQVLETEIFPDKQYSNGQSSAQLSMLNLAYYPDERGPYNYDVAPGPYSAGINANGTLKNPEKRWAGIMRKMETTDFEASNIEFIEFWLLDPFIYNATNGGELYFNLGNVSEDILKDSRKSFENGLPTNTTVINVDSTQWGRVPTIQPLINAFDNDVSARPFQDVGFDGLRDEDERTYFDSAYIQPVTKAFGTSSAAYAAAYKDPSGDDYHYFKGNDYNQDKTSILEGYKKYNAPDGNSVTSGSSAPSSATNIPDGEDINKDNTLNEAENYYQYRVRINPGEMNIGQNYITDIRTSSRKLPNGNTESVKWYQFKVPIQSPDRTVGEIEDFKSIRFMRMFLRGFDQAIVLRFAKLQLVRDEWRKYNLDLKFPGEYIPVDNSSATSFDVSTVSLEENGSRQPVPYIIPPGFTRPIDPASPNLRQLNEQSLVLKTCNLEDGDARAAYKNIQFDIRNYKKIKMFVHAESGASGDQLKKGDLVAFIRLGTDFNSNYYEYEIPLTPTPWNTPKSDENTIWPGENELDLELEKLYMAKQQRNEAMLINSGVTLIAPYTVEDGNNKISVVGNPKLNAVKTILIGIRNPKKKSNTDNDDGRSKCGEIWVNELRLSDFADEGGWAANARVNAKLADLGSIALAGSHSTFGFGSIEQKLNERKKTENTQYDISSNLELGKFLPMNSGIKVPMYLGYSENWIRPKFNPNEPDIPLQDQLDELKKNKQDSLRKEVIKTSEDYTLRRSINFTNVKKEKVKRDANSHFYDPENWALNYAYTETYRRTETIQYNAVKSYKAGIAYIFNNTPKNVTPFGKLQVFKSGYLKPIREFNFNYSPSSFSFRADLDRQYSEQLLRNTTNAPIVMDTSFNKIFNMVRTYDFKYDLTKALRFDFQATNNSKIDERPGRVNAKDADYKQDMDSIKRNLYLVHTGGRTVKYHHSGNVSYTLPFSKFPLTDWVSASAKYGFGYDWTAAPLTYDTLQQRYAPDPIGNIIQNSNTRQVNGDFNLVNLYNKIPYFKKLTQKGAPPKMTGKPAPPVQSLKDTLRNRLDSLKARADSIKKESALVHALKEASKVLISVKKASFTYSETNGMLFPGYLPKTQLIGMDEQFQGPTTGFIFGSQKDIREEAGGKGWVTRDTLLNNLFSRTYLQNFSARSSIEPFAGMKIELTANRNFSRNQSEYYRWDPAKDQYGHFTPTENGNFSISFVSINTAFAKDIKKDGDNHFSETFVKFRDNTLVVAQRLAQDNPHYSGTLDSTGYPSGYSITSQQVLIPAFLSAYTGRPAGTGDIKTQFPAVPKPNWRITYDGLSKYAWVQKYFSSVTLSHAYRSSYSINAYTSNLLYTQDEQGFTTALNDKKDYINKYDIGQVTLSEQFAPLASIDMSWKNSLLTRFEIKKDRNLSLSLANTQLTETRGSEFVIGSGYRLKNFRLPFKIGGKKIKLDNDVNLKADISIRNSKTVTRKVVENVNQATGGMTTFTLKTSADYVVNERLNVKLFFDKTINKPVTSLTYPTGNWSGGVNVRFTLSQ